MASRQGVEGAVKVENLAKKQKRELRFYNKIPVWICEYHQEVLPYIYRAIASKHLPFAGITLLHFDSHPDLMAPLEMKAEIVFDKDLLFDIVSIADWILPAVYAGHIRKVIWVKAPWAAQISDKHFSFHVGRHKYEGTIRVSSCEKYFCEDGLYASLDDLENCKELTVVVKTMPTKAMYPASFNKDVDKSYNDQQQQHKNTIPTSLCINTEMQSSNLSNLNCTDISCKIENCGIESCESTIFVNDILSCLGEPYILDIDMDFFSTLNPFETLFSKEEFEVLKHFYSFPELDSHHNIVDASQKHKENVKTLQRTLDFLDKSTLDSPDAEKHRSSINLDFLKFIEKWRASCSKTVDLEMVHSAGMTCNLPVHVTDHRDILEMMNTLHHLFSAIPKPTIITLARSSDDDYTPPNSVEFIQSHLITCLKNCYNEDIKFFHKYKDD